MLLLAGACFVAFPFDSVEIPCQSFFPRNLWVKVGDFRADSCLVALFFCGFWLGWLFVLLGLLWFFFVFCMWSKFTQVRVVKKLS